MVSNLVFVVIIRINTCLMISLPCIWFARIKGRGGAPGTGTAPASWAWTKLDKVML